MQVEQLTSSSVLSPIEASLVESAAMAAMPDTSSQKGQGFSVKGSSLFSPALTARVDSIVQQCTAARANVKELRAK